MLCLLIYRLCSRENIMRIHRLKSSAVLSNFQCVSFYTRFAQATCWKLRQAPEKESGMNLEKNILTIFLPLEF